MKDQERLDFFEALTGLIFEPIVTMESLLSEEDPPYGPAFLLALAISVFVPIFAQVLKYDVSLYRADAFLSMLTVVFFSILSFTILEGLLLQILGVEFRFSQLFALMSYCLAPLSMALWLLYAFNYFSQGSITLLNLLVHGPGISDDNFLHFLPFAFGLVLVSMMLLFFLGIRFLGDMHILTATVVTVFSLIPLATSLIVSVALSELVRPGSAQIFARILASPRFLTVFQ